MKRFAILLSATALSATAAMAQVADVDAYDADDDGFVSKEELTAAVPGFDMTFFDDIDINDDGRIAPEEMNTSDASTILSRYIPGSGADENVDVMSLDSDADGFVSEAEVMAAYPDFDPTFFDDIDVNDDGRWAPEEVNTGEAQTVIAENMPAAQSATFDVSAMDTDGDGFVSQDELNAQIPNFDQTFFGDIDVNDDGRWAPEEINTSEAQEILQRESSK